MEEIYFLRLWQWFKQMFAIIQEGCGSGWCRFTHRVMSACRGHHPGLWTLCGQRTVRAVCVWVFSNTPFTIHIELCAGFCVLHIRGGRLPALKLSPERFMLHTVHTHNDLTNPLRAKIIQCLGHDGCFHRACFCQCDDDKAPMRIISRSYTFGKKTLPDCVSISSLFGRFFIHDHHFVCHRTLYKKV